MRRQYLSKKALKELMSALSNRKEIDAEFVTQLRDCDEAYVVEYPRFKIYVFDGSPALFEHAKTPGIIMPTLFAVNTFLNSRGRTPVPWVKVDEGAVQPILRGADVMAPGIREYCEFSKDNIVSVLEPNKRYALAIGIALMNSSDIAPGRKGKCVKVVSRLNDDVWNCCIEIARKHSRS